MPGKLTAVLLSAAVAALAQNAAPKPDPRGIFVTPPANDSKTTPQTTAVKYTINLSRGGEVRPVAASYQFHSGDRFQVQFEASQQSYVYLLQREIPGDPNTMDRYIGAKGIVVVRDDEKSSQPPKYQLLWPGKANVAANTNRLAAHKAQSVPAAGQYFQFDSTAGLEKLVLIVSPKPIDIEHEFPGSTGAAPGKTNDSNNDVFGQLRRELEAMDNNTITAEPVANKGICVGDCSTYSAPKKPGDPFMKVVDLRHFQ